MKSFIVRLAPNAFAKLKADERQLFHRTFCWHQQLQRRYRTLLCGKKTYTSVYQKFRATFDRIYFHEPRSDFYISAMWKSWKQQFRGNNRTETRMTIKDAQSMEEVNVYLAIVGSRFSIRRLDMEHSLESSVSEAFGVMCRKNLMGKFLLGNFPGTPSYDEHRLKCKNFIGGVREVSLAELFST